MKKRVSVSLEMVLYQNKRKEERKLTRKREKIEGERGEERRSQMGNFLGYEIMVGLAGSIFCLMEMDFL